MEKIIENSSLEITEDSWPMLKDLENTRFSLKKRKSNSNEKPTEDLLSKIANDSNMEDQIISLHKNADELNVLDFIKNKDLKINKEDSLAIKEDASIVGVEKLQDKKPNQEIATSDAIKYATAGVAKVYVTNTNELLNPLKFLMTHSNKFVLALLQLIIPALITYFLAFYSGNIADQFTKEQPIVKIVFLGVFFFASMFVWISTQVVIVAVYRMLKKGLTDAIKIGQNGK